MNPKVFEKVIGGVRVSAYNDSNADWVCSCEGMKSQRFDQRKFTRKHAMQFMADQVEFRGRGQ